MRIVKIIPIVKQTETVPIINVEYEGELDDGTMVHRKLFSVQNKILTTAGEPTQALINLVTEDLKKEARRIEQERLKKEALTSIVERVIGFEVTEPIVVETTVEETTEDTVEESEPEEE